MKECIDAILNEIQIHLCAVLMLSDLSRFALAADESVHMKGC
jgi:hypothetical protein